MSNKLIDLDALAEYKAKSDLKYQDRLTAGTNISLSNDVISLVTTYVKVGFNSSYTVANNTIVSLESITLMPGIYVISYSCKITGDTAGMYQCGFSINTTDITGFGIAWGDTRCGNAEENIPNVFGTFSISASDYPNGRTFYFLTRQTSGSDRNVSPECYYLKL